MLNLNFWKKVNFDGPIVKEELGPCWLWTGHIDKRLNYGLYTKWNPELKKRKTYSVHRYAYLELFGELPEFTLDHLCRTRPCCNPWHVDDVTHKVNVLRGESPQAKNARKTHCKYGHELLPNRDRPGRYCLTCQNLRNSLKPRKGRIIKTHCKNGHELVNKPEHAKKQQKYCPICTKASMKAWWDRKRGG